MKRCLKDKIIRHYQEIKDIKELLIELDSDYDHAQNVIIGNFVKEQNYEKSAKISSFD